jgi:threonine/homoserine/homoserine lactone efflux protein
MHSLDWAWALHLALFAVVATFTPGPNALLLTTSAANFGLRSTLPAALGVWIGIPSLIILVGAGLGAAFSAVGALQLILHLAATAYILWLAKGVLSMRPPAGPREQGGARPLSTLQAAGLQWVNPKVWVMAVGAVGAYSIRGANPVIEILLIGGMFAVICLPAVTVWTLFGAAVRRWLGSPGRFTVFKVTMSALLALSIALTWTS